MRLPLLQIDAFTDEPFRGNPAAVCLLDAPRPDEWMLAVAAEMNLSETAFVVVDGSDGEVPLRWFTPKVEVNLCGHATLATAHALWETGTRDPDEPIRFATASGDLTCTVDRDETIWMDFPALPSEAIDEPDGLAEALGATPVRVARNRHDHLVELADAATVRELTPDLHAVARIETRAVVVTALADGADDVDEDVDFVSRCFGPRVGIDEDPVTGSAHCALGPWWAPRIGRNRLVGYQVSERGGIVQVEVRGERVGIGGTAVTVLRAELVEQIGGRETAVVAELMQYEKDQVKAANASGKKPVVFVHGLWLLPSSWDRWAELFAGAGFATVTAGWPDDPNDVKEANRHPEVFAHKSVKQVADHVEAVIRELKQRPAVIGHSFGGLLAEILAGRGCSDASVAISPAPHRGVLPLPISALRSSSPVLRNPANHGRAVPLTYEQFRYAFANAVTEDEAHELYNTYAVPAAGLPLFQAATANLNPWTEVKVKTKDPDRGPLLIIAGAKDHTVPWAICNSSFKRERRNEDAITEIVKIKDRGHALTIDHGWREVADTALKFVQRFVKP